MIGKRDWVEFLCDCLTFSLWCKNNTDANAFVSLCTRHWPRWRFDLLFPVSKATHQTSLGSLIFVWVQEQGRCLAQLQAQAFSYWLDLKPKEKQTNCVIGEVVSWPQRLWKKSSPAAVCSDSLVMLSVNDVWWTFNFNQNQVYHVLFCLNSFYLFLFLIKIMTIKILPSSSSSTLSWCFCSAHSTCCERWNI